MSQLQGSLEILGPCDSQTCLMIKITWGSSKNSKFLGPRTGIELEFPRKMGLGMCLVNRSPCLETWSALREGTCPAQGHTANPLQPPHTLWFRNQATPTPSKDETVYSTWPGYMPERVRSRILKRYLNTHVHGSIILNCWKVDTSQVSFQGEWVSKCDACTCACSVVSDSLWLRGLYVALQSPLSTDLSRKEYWSGLPFPFPEANVV